MQFNSLEFTKTNLPNCPLKCKSFMIRGKMNPRFKSISFKYTSRNITSISVLKQQNAQNQTNIKQVRKSVDYLSVSGTPYAPFSTQNPRNKLGFNRKKIHSENNTSKKSIKKQPQFNSLTLIVENNSKEDDKKSPSQCDNFNQSPESTDITQIQTQEEQIQFPNAMKYFRKRQSLPEEIIFLEELQDLLTKQKVYVDQNNPRTHKGEYISAKDLFEKQGYVMFQTSKTNATTEKSQTGLNRLVQTKQVNQGRLGDCYLMSVLASLAQTYPQIISQNILFDVNPANYFVVKLFLNGEWKYIKTDDQFPSLDGQKPCFAQPLANEIWVMLIEKCWAKYFSDYQIIQSGYSKDGFSALTGAPTQLAEDVTNPKLTNQDIFNRMKQAFSNRFVMNAAGSDYLLSLGIKKQQQIGLISDHAYSLLKIVNANGVELLKLRNPWGKTVWKGDWSFQSKKWTKDLRKKFDYLTSPDDGSFYIDSQNFFRYFGTVTICKVIPLNVHSNIKFTPIHHKSKYVRIKVSKTGRYVFSIYQQNERETIIQLGRGKQPPQNFKAFLQNSKSKNKQYFPARLIVMKVGENFEYIDSIQNSNLYDTSFETPLEEGSEYMISAKVEWRYKGNASPKEACLTSYGPQKVVFEEVTDRSIAPVFKQEMIKGFFNRYRGNKNSYDKTGAIGAYSESFFSAKHGIGYFYITNPHLNGFKLIHFLEGQGIKIIKPYKLPLEFQMTEGSCYLRGFFTRATGFSFNIREKITKIDFKKK